MKPLNLTIVMPTYNRSDLLKDSINAVLKSDYGFELLIIDDGSTDKTESLVKSFDDARITYYKHRANLGYARSLNDGIERARNSCILLCEDDVFIISPNDFLKILISEMTPKTIVATHLLANGREIKRGFLGKLRSFFAAPLAKEVYIGNGGKRRIVKFTNNCFGFNRNDITSRFDESSYVGNFFRIESDFQLRARKEGAHIVYNPRLVIDHKRHSSGGLRVRAPDKFLYQCMINHIAFLRKHYSAWNVYMYISLQLLARPTKWPIIKSALKTI